MRSLIFALVLGIIAFNVELYAQGSKVLITGGKILKGHGDDVLRAGGRAAGHAAGKTIRKAMTKAEFSELSEKELKYKVRELRPAHLKQMHAGLSQSDLMQKHLLSQELKQLGYGDDIVKEIDELPLNRELSLSIQRRNDNMDLLERLLKDLKNNEHFLESMNKRPMLEAYEKLSKTHLRTDPKHLDWINDIQRYSSKASNQSKLSKKYNIKDFRVTEKDGVIYYYDGEQLLASEKDNVITAWAGNPSNSVSNQRINNFLNQNLLPDSKYIVDNNYQYLVNDKGLVTEISTSKFSPSRSRNADLQAIGRDGFGEGSGQFAGGRKVNDKDDGGHLIANQLGGPSELINIVPQHMTVNRGTFKSLEETMSKAVKEGKSVQWKVRVNYTDPSYPNRPSDFEVEYWIDDIMNVETINNPIPIR